MSQFGLPREVDSVFQYAFQFVTHFELDTQSMRACPWQWPKPRQTFSNKDLHSNTTWNGSGESFNAGAHWCHSKHWTSLPYHFQHSPFPVLFLDPAHGPAFDVGQPGVASKVWRWLAASHVLGMWCESPSLDSLRLLMELKWLMLNKHKR